ncbi:response regulator [Paenibacillus azoreducens]|uniref:DNA-binding response regulator n=1 Tax=Paenibacillus azoreducens TaxID=116718 RepID=A0A919YCC1_9BACL|nr:response regulator [Paenibacillus azoreducens]GIO47108.1 DNA-binding response regulator [Paenibacillus azoreducens]
MLTILVVDDHKEEREGIAFLLQELGFPLKLQVAENGRKALEYLQQHAVDILFTDVRMPQMDGLQLTRQVLQLHPKTKVIIFSGYAEFEYAKTAITLGVSDYLLKPVNVEAFEATISKVIGELTQQQQQDETSQMTRAYVKKHILFTLVNGIGEPASVQDLLPDLPDRYQGMLLLEFEKEFFENAGPQFEDYLLSQLGAAADYLNLNGCQSLLLFPEGNGVPSHTSLRELALRIHDNILLEYKVNCYLSIKDGPVAIYSLAEVLPELEHWMEYRFFLPDTFVFDAKNELLFSEQSIPDVSDSQLLEQIRIHLKERDLFSLKSAAELLYQKYDRQVQYSQLYVKHIFSTVYEHIMSNVDAAQKEINLGIEKIYRAEDLRDIKSILDQGMTLLAVESSSMEPALNRDIMATKQYIEENYAADLSLELLAAKVYLSPHYLSSTFKKQTGCGINKYIKNVRMQKAKEMLTHTHLKIADICGAVGYRNISYFCQNFRDFYGHTPEKFRQVNQKTFELVEE